MIAIRLPSKDNIDDFLPNWKKELTRTREQGLTVDDFDGLDPAVCSAKLKEAGAQNSLYTIFKCVSENARNDEEMDQFYNAFHVSGSIESFSLSLAYDCVLDLKKANVPATDGMEFDFNYPVTNDSPEVRQSLRGQAMAAIRSFEDDFRAPILGLQPGKADVFEIVDNAAKIFLSCMGRFMVLYCQVQLYNKQYWCHKVTNAILHCHNEKLNPRATVEMGEKYSRLLKLRDAYSPVVKTRIDRARTKPDDVLLSSLSSDKMALSDPFRRSVFKKHNDADLAHLLLGDRDSRISVPDNGEDRLVFNTVVKDIGRRWFQSTLLLIKHLGSELMDIFPDEAFGHLRAVCDMSCEMLFMCSNRQESRVLTQATNHLCQAVLKLNPEDGVLPNRLGELMELDPRQSDYLEKVGERFGAVLEHVVQWVNEQRATDLNRQLMDMSVHFSDEQLVKFLQIQACNRLDLVNERTVGLLGIFNGTKMMVNTAVQRVFQHMSVIEPYLVRDVEQAIRHWGGGKRSNTARMDPGLQRLHALFWLLLATQSTPLVEMGFPELMKNQFDDLQLAREKASDLCDRAITLEIVDLRMRPNEAGIYPVFDLHEDLRVAHSPFSSERMKYVMPLLMHMTERIVYSDAPTPPKLSTLDPSIRSLVKRLRLHVKASWRAHSDTYIDLIRNALDANR